LRSQLWSGSFEPLARAGLEPLDVCLELSGAVFRARERAALVCGGWLRAGSVFAVNALSGTLGLERKRLRCVLTFDDGDGARCELDAKSELALPWSLSTWLTLRGSIRRRVDLASGREPAETNSVAGWVRLRFDFRRHLLGLSE
jgi:hypothetical protein